MPPHSMPTPSRWFSHLTPLQTRQEFMDRRDLAFGLLQGKLQSAGSLSSDFDIRPLTPADLRAVDPGCGFYEDWRVEPTCLGITDGVTGNRLVDCVMPRDRYMIFYGASVETPQYIVPETRLSFSSGANIKTVWFLTEMCAAGHRRFTSDLTPCYGSQDQIRIELAAVRSTDLIVDQLFGLIAEPMGSTITAAGIRA